MHTVIAMMVGVWLAAPAAPTRARRFDQVKGWRMLRWGVSQGDAERRLKAVGLPYKQGQRGRGYFNRRGAGLVHVDRSRLLFRWQGWRGAIEFRNGALDRVYLGRKVTRQAQIETLLRTLKRRYGKPNSHFRASPRAPQVERARWSSRTTTLGVSVSRYRGRTTLSLTWEALPRRYP